MLVSGSPGLEPTESVPVPVLSAVEEPVESQPKKVQGEQEDDIVFTPAKKSKKDKKKAKRKSTTQDYFDEPEPSKTEEVRTIETPLDPRELEPSFTAPLEEDGKEIVADQLKTRPEDTAEPLKPQDILHEEPKPSDEAPNDETPAETPVQEAEDFVWSVGKKSKKDKKKGKKRASLAADESETASPAPEPVESEAPALGKDAGLGLAAGAALAGAVTAAMTHEPESTPAETPAQEQDDFSWQPSTKKSKKDKKKRKSHAWADEEPSTPASQDEPVLTAAEERAGDIEGGQPATVDEVERHGQFFQDVVNEPEAVVPIADEVMLDAPREAGPVLDEPNIDEGLGSVPCSRCH